MNTYGQTPSHDKMEGQSSIDGKNLQNPQWSTGAEEPLEEKAEEGLDTAADAQEEGWSRDSMTDLSAQPLHDIEDEFKDRKDSAH